MGTTGIIIGNRRVSIRKKHLVAGIVVFRRRRGEWFGFHKINLVVYILIDCITQNNFVKPPSGSLILEKC